MIHSAVGLIDEFADRNPHLAERRGGEIYVAASAAVELINEAESSGIRILGMEGFIIGDRTYPALSRIADFSRDNSQGRPDLVAWSCQEARRIMTGPWRSAPVGHADQIHPDAAGRHMIAFVLEEKVGS
jgi:hypothetical protein